MKETPLKENDLYGLFELSKVDGWLKECLFVTPYKMIIDSYIKEHEKEVEERGGQLFVKKVSYLID